MVEPYFVVIHEDSHKLYVNSFFQFYLNFHQDWVCIRIFQQILVCSFAFCVCVLCALCVCIYVCVCEGSVCDGVCDGVRGGAHGIRCPPFACVLCAVYTHKHKQPHGHTYKYTNTNTIAVFTYTHTHIYLYLGSLPGTASSSHIAPDSVASSMGE